MSRSPPPMPLASLPARPPLPTAGSPVHASRPLTVAHARPEFGALTAGLLLAVVALAAVREAIGDLGRAIDRRFDTDDVGDAEDVEETTE